MKKVKFYTFGCKTNQYETQAMRELTVSTGGFSEAVGCEASDFIVVNTCTVTSKADKEARSMIRRFHRQEPNSKIIVTGCLAEKDAGVLKDIPGVFRVFPNEDKDQIARILSGDQIVSRQQGFIPLSISDFHDRNKAYIKVQDGCDNHCSYCKIPLVRGRSRSRTLEDVAEEAKRLIEKGFKELILTGICLGDWGKGMAGGPGLHDIIDRLDALEGRFRIRLSSIEPKMVTERLVSSLVRSKNVCHHLHIPLQSGSDRVLALMNRPYRGRDYVRLIRGIRQKMKGLSLTTDVMVGFPGETQRDFLDTVKVVKDIVPLRVHIFPYSRRDGTVASSLAGEVRAEIIKKRQKAIEAVAEDCSMKHRRRLVGRVDEALVENDRDGATGLLTGYTRGYVRFLLEGPDSLKNRLIPAEMVKVDYNTTYFKYLTGIV